jgi:hypothetical protein
MILVQDWIEELKARVGKTATSADPPSVRR